MNRVVGVVERVVRVAARPRRAPHQGVRAARLERGDHRRRVRKSHWIEFETGEARAGAGTRVYRYRFDHPGGGPRLRATHTAEVPLLFGTWRDGGPGERLGGHATGAEAVADAMVSAWTSFLHGQGPGWQPIAAGGGFSEFGVFGGRRAHLVESISGELTEA